MQDGLPVGRFFGREGLWRAGGREGGLDLLGISPVI